MKRNVINVVQQELCSLLPDLLTAKRRLRLSSQYSQCQTAGKVKSFQNKRPRERPACVARRGVPPGEERSIG